MDEIDDLLSRLTDIRGLGKGKIDSIMGKMGGPEPFKNALENGDVGGISSIDGVSHRMAVEMVLHFRGDDPGDLLRTEAARQIFDSVMEILKGYMHSDVSRNRASLLVPSGDIEVRKKEADVVFSYSSLLDGKDRERVERLLAQASVKSGGGRSRGPLPYILVVEDDEAYSILRKRGLDSRCLVVTPDEISPGLEQDMVLVYSKREIDEERLPIVYSVHCAAPDHEILPEIALEGMRPILGRINAVSELRGIFSEESCCGKVVKIIEELSSLSSGSNAPEVIREKVEEIRKKVEASLKDAITNLTLSGEDALSILSSGETGALKEVYREHAKMAADLVRTSIGARQDLFRIRYPLEVDQESLDSMISSMKEQAAGERFERKVRLASELVGMKNEVNSELAWALDLDWRFGLGCFVHDLGLSRFEVSDRFLAVKGAADIHLRQEGQFQAVSYHLGPLPFEMIGEFPDLEISDSRTAMLTGANSGGKTTLLMTLAQTVIMAMMGIPVPANNAYIPGFNKLFIYKPKRRLDAGGLESFLKELLPLSMKVDERSLVLADELEAMTELEAASRIIGIFLQEMADRGAYSVVVTHMADEVGKFTDCRVDGIEARGLDERHNLIVDRTPVIGLHARSTPELILRKLQAKAKGDEKKIYSRVLESFE